VAAQLPVAGDQTLISLFENANRGDPASGAALFTALYAELHRVASRELGRHGWGVSLGATSLLHEAYLDLSKRDGPAFPDRPRFLAYAARAMRGLVVDYARRRQALKRGGEFHLTAAVDEMLAVPDKSEEVVRIGQAVDDLRDVEPELAEIVDLKYFCGFSFEEIAAMKGQSERTVRRHWTKARVFLHAALRSEPPD
jgi:RNA polymerase sigma factor (TIGR02999 family)